MATIKPGRHRPRALETKWFGLHATRLGPRPGNTATLAPRPVFCGARPIGAGPI
jgi:hypothetical protein